MRHCRQLFILSFLTTSFSHAFLITQLYLNLFVAGVKALRDVGVEVVSVDPCSDPESAAEGAALARWNFQEFKSPAKRKSEIELVLHGSDETGLVCLMGMFNFKM